MADLENYQMAVDMLKCHLGLTEEEAKAQLGIKDGKLNSLTLPKSSHVPDSKNRS